MATSPFFKRIKADVLQIVRSIPEGSISTFASIGQHLDVPARHVAYILATLDPLEQMETPWHRVVGADGSLGRRKCSASGTSQRDLLEAEGVSVTGNAVGKAVFRAACARADELTSGVAKQSRPADAPRAMARKTRFGSSRGGR